MANDLTMTASTGPSEYWRRYLTDANPCTFRPLTDGVDDEAHQGKLSVDLTDSNIGSHLHELCIHNGLTLHTIFKAAWAVVLKSYTGSGAISAGSIINDDGHEVISIYATSIEDVDSLLKTAKAVQDDFTRSAPHQMRALSEIESFRGQDGRPSCNTALRFNEAANRAVEETYEEVVNHRHHHRIQHTLTQSPPV